MTVKTVEPVRVTVAAHARLQIHALDLSDHVLRKCDMSRDVAMPNFLLLIIKRCFIFHALLSSPDGASTAASGLRRSMR